MGRHSYVLCVFVSLFIVCNYVAIKENHFENFKKNTIEHKNKNFLFLWFPHCLLLCLLLKKTTCFCYFSFLITFIVDSACFDALSLLVENIGKKLRIIFSWNMDIHHNEKQIEFSPKFNVFKFSMTRSSIQHWLVHRQLVFHP